MSKSEPVVIPRGFTYQGYIAHGGQAIIHKVTPANDSTLAESGMYSLKDENTPMPSQLALRQIPNFDPQPLKAELESDFEKENRVKNLRKLAQEIEASLRVARGHPFIDYIGFYTGEHIDGSKELNFIMPLCDNSLWHCIEQSSLEENHIRMIILQVLVALELMHTRGYAHRDATAGNIFISYDPNFPIAYLADFGHTQYLGGTISEKESNGNVDDDDEGFAPPESVDGTTNECTQRLKTEVLASEPYTAAGTLPFRAPESLLQYGNKYDKTKLDIWAVGIVLLFCVFKTLSYIPGTQHWLFMWEKGNPLSDWKFQLRQIFTYIASYDPELWGEKVKQVCPELHKFFEENKNIPKLFDWHPYFFSNGESDWHPESRLTQQGIDVLRAMLTPDPLKRPTATELLEMPWFQYESVKMFRAGIMKRCPPQDTQNRPNFDNMDEDSVRAYLREKAPIISNKPKPEPKQSTEEAPIPPKDSTV